jgi:hypothetical protein
MMTLKFGNPPCFRNFTPLLQSTVRRIKSIKFALFVASLVLVQIATTASADIFVYRNYYGRMLFSDQPMEQPGYYLVKKIQRQEPIKQTIAKSTYKSVNLKNYNPQNESFEPGSVHHYEGIISKAADHYGIDPNLIKAVIKTESAFNPMAVSRAGAQGLMQLMPTTASDLNVSDPFDPYQNILGGSKYLSSLLKRFDNNIDLALAAYNAGPGTVTDYQGIPPYRETINYVAKVKRYRNLFAMQ